MDKEAFPGSDNLIIEYAHMKGWLMHQMVMCHNSRKLGTPHRESQSTQQALYLPITTVAEPIRKSL